MLSIPDGFDIPIPFINQTFHIYFYGILITLGVIAAALIAHAEAKRRGMNPEVIWDALFWVVLAGIIGARIWHVLIPGADVLVTDPATGELVNPYFVGGVPRILDMINLRKGGLGIPGAVIAGALALWFYCRKRRMSFLTWADVAAPGVALAQAIGRWGNYFNQELVGFPTNLPWKMYVDPARRPQGFEQYEYFQPLFLYESLLNVISMVILLWLARRFDKWLKPGDIFYLYACFYAVIRFSLEFLRVDHIGFNQYFMVAVFIVAGGIFYWNHRPKRA